MKTQVTIWVDGSEDIGPGSVSMMLRLGENRLFFDDDESGVKKIQEIIDALELIKAAGPLYVAGKTVGA